MQLPDFIEINKYPLVKDKEFPRISSTDSNTTLSSDEGYTTVGTNSNSNSPARQKKQVDTFSIRLSGKTQYTSPDGFCYSGVITVTFNADNHILKLTAHLSPKTKFEIAESRIINDLVNLNNTKFKNEYFELNKKYNLMLNANSKNIDQPKKNFSKYLTTTDSLETLERNITCFKRALEKLNIIIN